MIAGVCGVTQIACRVFTVKLTPLLSTPLACTTTLPLVAPVGTVTAMLLALQVLTVAVVPLNLTVLLPCVAPKLAPATVTEAPTNADVGVRPEIDGAGGTAKLTPFVLTPLAFTTTFPVVAPVGTFAVMLLALQVVMAAVVPLNFTEPLPCAEPKFEPALSGLFSRQLSGGTSSNPKRTSKIRGRRRARVHAARNIYTPGATPLRTTFGRPKFFGVAPGV